MTDVKRLLAEATPLPWKQGERHPEVIRTRDWLHAQSSEADAALIVYAVNHLPDYLAAVEALDDFIEARAALARLRDEVPA